MFTRARVAAERRPLASLDAPSQESQSGRRGVPRLAGPNVGLLNPDYHHPQLLELCELNQKRWESLTIPNQALGGLGAKERSEATSGPAAQALSGPEGPDSKGEYCAAVLPQLRPLTFDLKKQTSKKLGYSITPTSRVWGFPEVRSPNEHAKSRGLD